MNCRSFSVRFYRLGVVVFAGLLLPASFLFAGGAQEAEKPLVVIQNAEPPGLDPVVHREGPTYNVTINIFDSLLRKTRDGRNVPALAEKLERDSDNSWLIHLRPDVEFHNGEPLTAEAVKYTIERIFEPELDTTRAADFDWVEEVEIIDDLTVRIIANEPFALAEHYFTELQIVPPNYVEDAGDDGFNEKPVGTGPFKLVEWDRGNKVVLEKNENYWGDSASIDDLEFRFIESASSRVATLLGGDADLIADPPITAQERIDRNDNTRFEAVTGTRVMFVGIDTVQDTPLQEPLVRRALNYAVDKDQIIDNLLYGLAEETTTLLTEKDLGFNDDVEPYPYDPDKARELLAEAGYEDGFEVDLDTTQGRYINDVDVAQAIAGFLKDVGVTVNVETYEFGAFNERLFSKQTSPMYLVGWGNPLFDPAYIFDFVARTGSLLRTIEDEEIDKYLADARSTTNQERRRELYEEVIPIMHEKAPAVFLYKQPVLYGMSNRLDWEPRPDEFLLMDDAKLR